MGLLAKKFEHNGLELNDVYLGVELTMCNSSITNCTVHAYSSVDWRAKGKAPFASIDKSYRFTKEDLSTLPVYKLIYNKLKDEYGDAKDLKDIDQVKKPEIVSTELSKDAKTVTVKGVTVSEDDVIESVFPVSRKKKEFTVTIPVEDYISGKYGAHVYLKAEQANMIGSEPVELLSYDKLTDLKEKLGNEKVETESK